MGAFGHQRSAGSPVPVSATDGKEPYAAAGGMRTNDPFRSLVVLESRQWRQDVLAKKP